MTAQPLDPPATPTTPALPPLTTVRTFMPQPTAYGTTWEDHGLCLATWWEHPGDPMPMVCARKRHDPDVDPRHLTYRYAGYEPITWTNEEQQQ